MDGQISNPSMFVPPAAAAKAYLITELGNIFPVEDVTTGQAPINNQGQANHTDAIGLALGQAIVGSGMYLKSVKTPVGYTLVYHGDGQVTTVPLVPYTRLPDDADFAMVYPSGQDIIEINVTRFDAAYSRYDSYTQTLAQTPPSYSDVFRHTGTMQTNVTGMTIYRVDPSLYDRSVYMTTNATDPGFSVTFATSDVDPFRDWVHDKGYHLFYSNAYNYTDIDYNPGRRSYSGTAVNYANLSSSPGVTLHTTGHGNLYYEALLASYNQLTEEVENTPGVCYTDYSYVDDAPAILNPRNRDFTLNFIGPANATTIESFYESSIRYSYHRSYHNSCPGPAIDRERTVNASLEVWDRGFRHDAILQVDGIGSHTLTVPYPNNGPLYMIVGPEPVDITMVEFDLASDRFSVGGLPRNTPYVISDDDGNDVGAGVTSGSGSISKTLGSISNDLVPGDGGVLRLYPVDAPHYDGYINVVSFDMRNDARVDNHHGSNSTFAYVPVIYARLAFIADAEVDHVTLNSKILGEINMDHLAGNYLKNQALMVPILPGATSLDLTINGFDLSVLVSDMRVEGTSGLIGKETNSYSSNTVYGNRVSAGSTATSNAFAIATSNGTMTAEITMWVTGEANMSLDSEYVIEADINKRVIRSFHTVRSHLLSSYSFSLYSWPNDIGTARINSYFDAQGAVDNMDTLAERKSDLRQAQNIINNNYRLLVTCLI